MYRLLCSFRDFARRVLLQLKFNNSPEISELPWAFDCNNLSGTKQAGSVLNSPSVLDTIIGDGFLWAVPKNRRSIERRLTRKMGYGKMLIPKKNILVCETCGHFHLAHTVCGNCYEKVKKETEIMQEAIQAGIKLKPIEKDVVVLYEDDVRDEEIMNGKRIVELPKKRPAWFSRNLLSRDAVTKKQTTVGEHFKQPILKDNN